MIFLGRRLLFPCFPSFTWAAINFDGLIIELSSFVAWECRRASGDSRARQDQAGAARNCITPKRQQRPLQGLPNYWPFVCLCCLSFLLVCLFVWTEVSDCWLIYWCWCCSSSCVLCVLLLLMVACMLRFLAQELIVCANSNVLYA